MSRKQNNSPLLNRAIGLMLLGATGLLLMILLQLFVSPDEPQTLPDTGNEQGALEAEDRTSDSGSIETSVVVEQSPVDPETGIFEPALGNNLFASLLEIAARISEGQTSEAENELAALVERVDRFTDEEKLAFMEWFINYSNNNAFNPEAITAFDTLWSQLSLAESTATTAARILGAHYVANYEFAFALQQFNVLRDFNVDLDTSLTRDLARAEFNIHQYEDAIATLQQHIELSLDEGKAIERTELSLLFTAHLRLGNMEDAEIVGRAILAQFDDIQDWRDMAQFYQETGNEAGLVAHLQAASEAGYLDSDGEWLETSQ